MDIYLAFSPSDMISECSHTGQSPMSMGLDCFIGGGLETYIHRYLAFYLYTFG